MLRYGDTFTDLRADAIAGLTVVLVVVALPLPLADRIGHDA